MKSTYFVRFISICSVFTAFFSFTHFSAFAQYQEGEYMFSNFRVSAGNIYSQEPKIRIPNGRTIGFTCEGTMYDNGFGAFTFDYNFGKKSLDNFTFDLGAGASAFVQEDMDLFIGISLVSFNFNSYAESDYPISSSLFYKLRYKKYIFEAKTNVWNWKKGKDPVLYENGYYGFSYLITKNLNAGLMFKTYSKDVKYIHLLVGLMF